MGRKLAVIGVGNMAKAIIKGVVSSKFPLDEIILFDKNEAQYEELLQVSALCRCADDMLKAVEQADCILLAVKPQNYDEVLKKLSTLPALSDKLFISIGAGITAQSVSDRLGGACVIRVLPNVPMLIGRGVSVICQNSMASKDHFDFVVSVFQCAGSVLIIDESEMNRIIGVTSSSPAYVFRFIQAIYEGALQQGVSDNHLLETICDVVIGSAYMLKHSEESPSELIAKVASKGGTTEQALIKLQEYGFSEGVTEAMKACTARADELSKV